MARAQMTRGMISLSLALPFVSPSRLAASDCDVVTLASGWDHFLAVRTDDVVLAWGCDAQYGQLGDDTTISDTNVSVQVDATDFGNATAIATGELYSRAIRASDGTAWGLGGNYRGQLGIGGSLPDESPHALPDYSRSRAAMIMPHSSNPTATFTHAAGTKSWAKSGMAAPSTSA